MPRRTRVAPRSKPDIAPTVGDLIALGEHRFKAAHLAFGHGVPGARDEAAHLTLHALGIPAQQLSRHLARRVTPGEQRKALRLFARRIEERKPSAYLTGVAWLGGLSFRVDERVIIPRSYIAELLDEALHPWIAHPERIGCALDLCTGCGCLAILMAQALAHARIDAADISRDALKLARRNVGDYRLRHRIRLVHSDLYGALGGRRYDLIVSNPPYVKAASMRRLPLEYRHEPQLALAGGRDGLDCVRRIVNSASAHLNPRGMLIVEVGHARRRVERAFPGVPFTWPYTSGGDDCVFVVSREELARASPA